MKTITLNLPYNEEDLTERPTRCPACGLGGEEKLIEPAELTRRLLGFAVRTLPEHREGLPKDKLKTWGRITRAMKGSNGTAALSEEQFDFLFKATEGVKWPVANAEAVTLLLEHLEDVKIGKPEASEPVKSVGSPDGSGSPEVAASVTQ